MDHSKLIAIAIILFILLSWAWRYRIKPYFAANELHQRFKHHPDWKRIKHIEKILIKLYQNVNSASVSLKERNRLHIEEDAFIYGEIQFLSFYGVLERIAPKPGEVFYDLGSGAGKAVFTAALYFDLSKVCGVEFLPALHTLAEQQLRKAKLLFSKTDDAFSTACLAKLNCIEFINGDFLHEDFSDGDIVFINATCLSFPTWDAIVAKLHFLKTGSRIIVLSKHVSLPSYRLLFESRELMSWGLNSVNVYIKHD